MANFKESDSQSGVGGGVQSLPLSGAEQPSKGERPETVDDATEAYRSYLRRLADHPQGAQWDKETLKKFNRGQELEAMRDVLEVYIRKYYHDNEQLPSRPAPEGLETLSPKSSPKLPNSKTPSPAQSPTIESAQSLDFSLLASNPDGIISSVCTSTPSTDSNPPAHNPVFVISGRVVQRHPTD